MPEDSCKKSIMAASEVLSEAMEECGGQFVENNEIEAIVWVPDKVKEKVGHSPNNPVNDDDKRKELVESCAEGDWARSWARSVLGSGASESQVEATAKQLCRGLYSE